VLVDEIIGDTIYVLDPLTGTRRDLSTTGYNTINLRLLKK